MTPEETEAKLAELERRIHTLELARRDDLAASAGAFNPFGFAPIEKEDAEYLLHGVGHAR